MCSFLTQAQILIRQLNHDSLQFLPQMVAQCSLKDITSQGELGKGSFQELDQVAAVKQFTKYAGQAKQVKDIVPVISAAVKVEFYSSACKGKPLLFTK